MVYRGKFNREAFEEAFSKVVEQALEAVGKGPLDLRTPSERKAEYVGQPIVVDLRGLENRYSQRKV